MQQTATEGFDIQKLKKIESTVVHQNLNIITRTEQRASNILQECWEHEDASSFKTLQEKEQTIMC